jgi:hypothetical protein
MKTIGALGWFRVAPGDVQGTLELCDDDAVHAAPFAREERTDRLEGNSIKKATLL